MNRGLRDRVVGQLGRIRVRLLVVNLIVLLVPMAGLELARVHERQLLDGLERDMRNQASLVGALLQADLARGVALGDAAHGEVLRAAAKRTRTRIRVLDREGGVVVDSHEDGPPEGPEPHPPSVLPRVGARGADYVESAISRYGEDKPRWPEVADRLEVKSALAGAAGARTRIRDREPAVFLFITEPVRSRGVVIGAVYVVRSTMPVLVELYQLRSGLIRVMAIALIATAAVTLLLAWSISRPLGRLSRAAKRVAAGERDVSLPVGGGGEIRELGASFVVMKDRLDARMRYISDFAADVAHELKSPLTSIRGAAELLEDGAADDPLARARFLRNITLDVDRMDRLVSRLLQLSRIEASSEGMKIVDLESLALRVVRREGRPGPAPVLRYEAPSRFFPAREADLQIAIDNLVDNAARFSPEGVPVEIVIDGGPPERTVRIRVTDHGPGIAPANRPRIFDRFFTTDVERGGTGLGLSIVRAVVEAHGGVISVESTLGEGATFLIELPCGPAVLALPGSKNAGRARGQRP